MSVLLLAKFTNPLSTTVLNGCTLLGPRGWRNQTWRVPKGEIEGELLMIRGQGRSQASCGGSRQQGWAVPGDRGGC